VALGIADEKEGMKKKNTGQSNLHPPCSEVASMTEGIGEEWHV
jgi:hypothetical protein